ncbi:MAG TPA: Rid family detoxifying hydrolase [Conexivisphaerales archaeon]|nr:Rid family detoxifying hydrolase [Conexivisphaerales archaeon]
MIEKILSPEAPKPVGPYSQGIRAGHFVFVSAQLGLDPATGALCAGLEAQASRALDNVESVLRQGGASWNDVAKVTVYLSDISDFDVVNRVYSSKLGSAAPARSTLGVASLPKGGRVAFDAVAWLP